MKKIYVEVLLIVRGQRHRVFDLGIYTGMPDLEAEYVCMCV
jgi:hypothetical protein